MNSEPRRKERALRSRLIIPRSIPKGTPLEHCRVEAHFRFLDTIIERLFDVTMRIQKLADGIIDAVNVTKVLLQEAHTLLAF